MNNELRTRRFLVSREIIAILDFGSQYGQLIARRMALTPKAAQVSCIPYVMDAYREEAEKIVNA